MNTKPTPIEDRPKLGYVVGPSLEAVIADAKKHKWRDAGPEEWLTPRGDKVRWAPVGKSLSEVLKKHVVFFVDGWKDRRDAAQIAVHVSRVGCQTLTLGGRKVSLHSVRIDKPARKKGAQAAIRSV